ncbi:hypothetical protein BC834DRAFT_873159 [Gloeopeniophorella convolvens]|nr:hypothetical protein BC834DRAFT_873159 [Gloeopeniophorella convolvens]
MSRYPPAYAPIQQALRGSSSYGGYVGRRVAWTPPVYKLPMEVLGTIFMFCSANEPLGMEEEGSRWVSATTECLGWVKVSHVCRMWRSAAISEPRLWNDLTVNLGKYWITLMLQRAKAVPLGLDTVVEDADERQAISSLFTARSQHFRTVGLSSDDALVGQLPTVIHGRTWTLLEKLVLLHEPPKGHRPTPAGARHAMIPSCMITHSRFPRLQHLSLRGYHFMWASVLQNSLTHLEIMSPDDTYAARVAPQSRTTSFDNITLSLRYMPHLQTLTLIKCLPPCVSSPNVQQFQLNMPYMSSVALDGNAQTSLGLAQRLRIPPSARLALNHLPTRQRASNCLPIVQHLAAHVRARGTHLPPIQGLRISHEVYGPALVFEAWSIPKIPHGLDGGREAPILEFCVEYNPHSLPLTFEYVKQVCRTLPLDDLRAVAIDMPTHPVNLWPEDGWNDIFAKYQKIRYMEVSGAPAVRLIAYLAPNKRRQLHYPALRELTISEVELGRPYGLKQQLGVEMYGNFTMRARMNAPVRKVTLAACKATSWHVQTLRSVVPQVQVQSYHPGDEPDSP